MIWPSLSTRASRPSTFIFGDSVRHDDDDDDDKGDLAGLHRWNLSLCRGSLVRQFFFTSRKKSRTEKFLSVVSLVRTERTA